MKKAGPSRKSPSFQLRKKQSAEKKNLLGPLRGPKEEKGDTWIRFREQEEHILLRKKKQVRTVD